MSGLLERTTQRPGFQRNPGRASRLIHAVASGMVSHPDRRLSMATSPWAVELVIRASSIVPQAVFGVLFMCCDCPPGDSPSGTIEVSDEDGQKLVSDLFRAGVEGTDDEERIRMAEDVLDRFEESHK